MTAPFANLFKKLSVAAPVLIIVTLMCVKMRRWTCCCCHICARARPDAGDPCACLLDFSNRILGRRLSTQDLAI